MSSRPVRRTAMLVSVLLGVVATVAMAPGVPARSPLVSRRVVRVAVPHEISFREDERGFVTQVWVNGAGPYVFVIDTGAGMTIVSPRVAAEAQLRGGRTVSIAGLSGRVSKAVESAPARIAAGSATNRIPAMGSVTISQGLPTGVDGLLDPASAFWPLGFVIDCPAGTVRAFDASLAPVLSSQIPEGGTVTPWLLLDTARRPFVSVGESRSALIDTGSGLGLVLPSKDARSFGLPVVASRDGERIRDVGGGTVHVQRRSLDRVRLGGMTLENVPTDVLSGADPSTPMLLGRDVLRPFVISFDPRSRLIRIALG